MAYDSAIDTVGHIRQVGALIEVVRKNLTCRRREHDRSKLMAPEKEMYDEFTPKLKGLTYGSDEYKETLSKMGAALRHHYQVNSHHPEHFENGINGMTLLDLIEMLADWKAAGLRHANGDFGKSLDINRQRFAISDQLAEILENTARELGWI